MPTKEDALKGLENPLISELEKQGIDIAYLSQKLKEALEAKSTVFAKHKGKILGRVNVIAWSTREEARKDAHKLRGDYPAEKKELSGPGGEPLFISPEEKAQLKKLADMVVEEEKRKIREGK